MFYVMAQDLPSMATPNRNVFLPLHHSLYNRDVALGAVKLLAKRNPAALQTADIQGAFPLHLACEYGTVEVVNTWWSWMTAV